jgi:biopolymer transport protein ExbB
MNITERFLAFTLLGAQWVLWLLIILSVLSFAVMIERAWFFASHAIDVTSLMADLRRLLGKGNIQDARARVKGSESSEMVVIAAGLAEYERGIDAMSEAMVGQKARERMRLERNLVFLATLGNNAPFVGLFGTVIGIIKAFHDLAGNQTGGAAIVMAGISEALVATAVGLLVALPAVVAFNYFNRRVRGTMANVDALAHVVLAQLKGEGDGAATSESKEKPASGKLSEAK